MSGTQTLAIIKPDAVSTGKLGPIIAHIEKAGFKIREARLVRMSRERAEAFYEVHRGRPFYEELVKTQQVLNKKHLGWAALKSTAALAAGHLLRGQTNFVKMLWKFNSVYNPKLQIADHQRPVSYEMALPPPKREHVDSKLLYILPPKGRRGRALDDSSEQFVEATRTGTSA